ncbi:unnamed protein product [Ascophyllum nodosum]
MIQAPRYTVRVRHLAAQKASLKDRVANLQIRTAGLRESLPVQVQRHEADRMARWRSELTAFQEQREMAFVVSYPGGVAIRSAPSVEAPCMGDVLHGNEAFWASERLGRLGEDTIYVKLRDGRGWVFENLNGTKVLSRVVPSLMSPSLMETPSDRTPPPAAEAVKGAKGVAPGTRMEDTRDCVTLHAEDLSPGSAVKSPSGCMR